MGTSRPFGARKTTLNMVGLWCVMLPMIAVMTVILQAQESHARVAGPNVLVIGDGSDNRYHSLIRLLSSSNFDVRFQNLDAPTWKGMPDLRGTDTVILAASKLQKLTKRDIEKIQTAVDQAEWHSHRQLYGRVGDNPDGTNLIVFASSGSQSSVRTLLNKFKVDFAFNGKELVPSDGNNDKRFIIKKTDVDKSLPTVMVDPSRVWKEEENMGVILDNVVGFRISNETRAFTSEIVHVKTKQGRIPVVVGIQGAETNARVLAVGSSSLLWNIEEKSVQYNLLRQLMLWGCGRTGQLRLDEVKDWQISGYERDVSEHGELFYTTGDHVAVNVTMSTMNEAGEWVPYVHNEDHLQGTWFLQHPYLNVSLSSSKNDGVYSGDFVLPDKFGVFKFQLFVDRPGYSRIHFERVLGVRPPKVSQIPHFHAAAAPYYLSILASALCAVVMLIVFCVWPDHFSPSSSSSSVDSRKPKTGVSAVPRAEEDEGPTDTVTTSAPSGSALSSSSSSLKPSSQ